MSENPMLDLLILHLTERGISEPAQEYRFHEDRKWRFDLAWPDVKIAFELEGGTRSGGRHVRGEGYERDCEKYNAASIAGWVLIRATTEMVSDGRARDTLIEAFRARCYTPWVTWDDVAGVWVDGRE